LMVAGASGCGTEIAVSLRTRAGPNLASTFFAEAR
jgi:hypothetical protein